MAQFRCKSCWEPASGCYIAGSVCAECRRNEYDKLKRELANLFEKKELRTVHRDALEQIFDVAEAGEAAITLGDEAEYAKSKCREISSLVRAIIDNSPVAVPVAN